MTRCRVERECRVAQRDFLSVRRNHVAPGIGVVLFCSTRSQSLSSHDDPRSEFVLKELRTAVVVGVAMTDDENFIVAGFTHKGAQSIQTSSSRRSRTARR